MRVLETVNEQSPRSPFLKPREPLDEPPKKPGNVILPSIDARLEEVARALPIRPPLEAQHSEDIEEA